MTDLPRRIALVLPLALPGFAARAEGGVVHLYRVVGARDEVTIGLTEAELARLGTGPDVGRIARLLVAQGQITAWRYAVARAPDGSTRFAPASRVAILRHDALRIEPYVAALPVLEPPSD